MFKYIALLLLITQLHAVFYQKDFQIGYGYDSNTYRKKLSPFGNFETKKDIVSINIKKIIEIKNYEELFDILQIPKSLLSKESKIVKKILDNQYINNYTLTYLIYNRVTDFKKSLLVNDKIKINFDNNFTKLYGNVYVDSIDYGGEFIAFVHIKTNSVNEYKKVKKELNKTLLKWKNIDNFGKKIREFSNKNIITIKNIINADSKIVPTNSLEDIISNAKNFSNSIENNPIPYRANIKYYDTKIEDKDKLIPFLKAKFILNNFDFIKRNTEQFENSINKDSYQHIKSFLKKTQQYNCYPSKEFIDSLEHVSYPKRYNYRMIDHPIKIAPLNLPNKTVIKRYKKISDKIVFTLNYSFDLELKNSGKVVILNWTKKIYENKKLIHKEKNSKIILDSYVNFRGLKAINLTNINFGTLTYKTKFDSYEKSSKIIGKGIIDNAECGYTVDNIGTLDLKCKDIKLKNLEIKFEHNKQ